MSTGTIRALCIRPGRRVEPELRDALTLDSADGVVDDHGTGAKRQITILSEEAWNDTAAALGSDLPWTTRRANVLVSGLDLSTLLLGGTLTLGSCTIEVLGETFPCDQMDEACTGLKDAMLPATRGGVYGRIVGEGTISTGDRAEITAPGKKKALP